MDGPLPAGLRQKKVIELDAHPCTESCPDEPVAPSKTRAILPLPVILRPIDAGAAAVVKVSIVKLFTEFPAFEECARKGRQVMDMKQFYDGVALPLLSIELMKRGYPPHLFVLGFFAHAAPRVLQVGKCVGPPVIDCGNSMLAG